MTTFARIRRRAQFAAFIVGPLLAVLVLVLGAVYGTT